MQIDTFSENVSEFQRDLGRSNAVHQQFTNLNQEEQSADQAWKDFHSAVQTADLSRIEPLFGAKHGTEKRRKADRAIGEFLMEIDHGDITRDNRYLSHKHLSNDPSKIERSESILRDFLRREELVRIAYSIHKDRFPTDIWYCCKRLCFATISSDPLLVYLFDEIINIHRYAEGCHKAAESLGCYIEDRGKGIGTSTVAYATASRNEREEWGSDPCGTPRQKQMLHFSRFVAEVLPFLYGKVNSPRGTKAPKQKLCTKAICCILGVSRNFLYYRKKIPCSDKADEADLHSLVDTTGLRLRQLRREGSRGHYPPLQSLQTFDCGCDIPCFAESSPWALASEYEDFSKLSRQLSPRHKENTYLLNRLYDPYTGTTDEKCNRALSALYAVSQALISDVRLALNKMCAQENFNENGLLERKLLDDGSLRYKYFRGHPMNRYDKRIREKIETTLDFVLRSDPSGSNGKEGHSVYRVYDPDINTQEKLHDVIKKELDEDSDTEVDLSPSSLRRMVNDYLKERGESRISFQQSDHNACPWCKTLKYSILQFHSEVKLLKRSLMEVEAKLAQLPRPLTSDQHTYFQKRIDDLNDAIKTKQYQEDSALKDMKEHNERDARIRGFLKELGDYFRDQENRLRREGSIHESSHGWNTLRNHACISHQDDMTKVDLPHFVVNASSDITRWRFDANAHVSSITNDAVIFSHEQGGGAKNAAMIFEEILLHHLITCRGEDVKIIVSDNASVGKNWLTTIAMPQYFVDQDLAKVVMVVFLENNHGKWLADMLFGQFQTRRRRSVLLGIDDLLGEFQRVKHKSGNISGFAINPLSCVDFGEVLRSLGYQTSPPSGFNFPKRNIHFSTACAPGAKRGLPPALKNLIEDSLPDDLGVVRISTEPPRNRSREKGDSKRGVSQHEFFDVPAMQLSSKKRSRGSRQKDSYSPSVPLVVPLHQPFKEKGNLVVSHRTAQAVDYNGLGFRKSKACPELSDTSKPLVRRAWPRALLDAMGQGEWSEEPQRSIQETLKCAPENWIVRRPVSFYCKSKSDWIARYPPRNLLNAKFRRGPRDTDTWIVTKTYGEAPFPIMPGTCAERSAERLAKLHVDETQSMHVLQILRAIFEDMDEERDVSDAWLQREVTIPSRKAVDAYKERMRRYALREEGSPAPAKSTRQFFKEDPVNVEKVASEVRKRGINGIQARRFETKMFGEMFTKAECTPSGLDRYVAMMERDVERYSREIKAFELLQQRRDEEERRKAIAG